MNHLQIEFERACDACNLLAAQRHDPNLDTRALLQVLNAHEKAAKLVSMLATRLGITPHARMSAKVAGVALANKPTSRSPWAPSVAKGEKR